MTSMHYADTAHSIAAGLLLFATAYPFVQVTRSDETHEGELTNRELVVANMTADLQYFHLCSQQAAMLAEQTADFGILGLMTTVAAVGISTEPAGGRERFDRVAYEAAPAQVRVLAVQDR